MKTITIEVDDAIAERIDQAVAIRAKLGEPTTAEALTTRWLSDHVRQHLARDLVRHRGLETAPIVLTRAHGWGA